MESATHEPTTFVLVHGAWHGGWCWARFASALDARGYRSVAMDLPIEDGGATFHDYAQVVLDAIPPDAESIVVVGHSLGGMTLPLIAARRPPRALVYLHGVVPKPGGSPWDDGPEMTAPGVWDGLVTHDDRSVSVPFDIARKAFYPDCTEEDARWAFERLRRQDSASLWLEPYPVLDLPPVPQISIAGTFDRVVTLTWAKHVAATRLGVHPIELPAGHSSFFSHPELLADTILQHVV